VSHQQVLSPHDWDYQVKNRKLFYVSGVATFLRLFPSRKIKFLKEEKLPGLNKSATDLAIETVQSETTWQSQALLNWEEGLATSQLRRVREPGAVGFTKAVHTIVACELAIRAFCPDVSQYWVYDYMRMIPAVYNIDNLSQAAVDQIMKAPNSAVQLRKIAGPDGVDVLSDLRSGQCVTAKTAHLLVAYANRYILGPSGQSQIGPVRCRPGKRKLGTKNASEHEYVDVL
jgi:hypothetical protein